MFYSYAIHFLNFDKFRDTAPLGTTVFASYDKVMKLYDIYRQPFSLNLFLLIWYRNLFDPLLSPLKMPSDTTLSFIRRSLESSVPRHQVEALTWLQVGNLFLLMWVGTKQSSQSRKKAHLYSLSLRWKKVFHVKAILINNKLESRHPTI